MRKWFQRQTLSSQLLLAISLSLLCLLLALNAYIYRATKSYERSQAEYLNTFSQQLQLTVQANYNSLSRIAKLVAYSESTQNYLLAPTAKDRYILYSNLMRSMIDISTLNSEILDIVIVNNKGQRVNLSDTAYTLPNITCPNSTMYLSPLQMRESLPPYLVACKNISSIDSYNQTSQLIGKVYLVLSSTAFTSGEKIASQAGNSQIFLLDRTDHILWKSAEEQPAAEQMLDTAEKQPALLLETNVPAAGMRIVAYRTASSSPVLAMWGEQGQSFLIALLLTCVLMLIWFAFARNTVRSYQALIRFFDAGKRDGLQTLRHSVHLTGSREAERVSMAVNDMLQKMHDLTQEVLQSNAKLYESELLARQAELMHLRSEINPHFLYNTLETMVGIAFSENQPEFARIARSLSLIFKYSIKGKDRVPLHDEVKVAKNYLSIQQYRFKDRFEVSYDLPDACLSCMMPKMLLQPLIENTIVHGVEDERAQCHIRLGAAMNEDSLTITVQDDGAGIPPDTLRALQEDLRAPLTHSDEGKHIGLRNVNARLRLLFGNAYGLALESTQGKGTTVTLRLPVTQEEPICIK